MEFIPCENRSLVTALPVGHASAVETTFSPEGIMKTMKLHLDLRSRASRWARTIAGGLACFCLTGSAALTQEVPQGFLSQDQPSIPGLVPDVEAPNLGLEGSLPRTQEGPPGLAFQQPAEVKKVNDALAGWNAAESGRAFNLGETLRRCWVMLDSEGKLRGQILGSDFDHSKTDVCFLREGRVIEKLSANTNGEFLVYGLEEGVYSLLVANEGRYAVNCLIVLDNSQMGGPSSSFNIPMSDPSPRSVFEQVVSRASKVTFRNFGEFAFEETAEDPARLYGIKGISEHRPATDDSTTLGNNRVELTGDGQLIGRIRAVDHLSGRPVDLMVTEVQLIANDEPVSSTQTNRYGVFSFSDVKPGFYTLFASGKDGLVVTSFELVDAPVAAVEVAPVSFRRQNSPNYLDVTLSPRRDVGWINAYFRDHVPPPRIAPIEDVPYNPYSDYGQMGWGGAGYPYGMGMGSGYPSDSFGSCGLCGELGWSESWTHGFRQGCLGRWKAKCGLHRGCAHGCGSGCDSGCCGH